MRPVHYFLGLGWLGQGKTEVVRKEVTQATQMNLAQPWAAHYANTKQVDHHEKPNHSTYRPAGWIAH